MVDKACQTASAQLGLTHGCTAIEASPNALKLTDADGLEISRLDEILDGATKSTSEAFDSEETNLNSNQYSSKCMKHAENSLVVFLDNLEKGAYVVPKEQQKEEKEAKKS